MIKTELIGGLGNNMFQYALGRILADDKNYNLRVPDMQRLAEHFKNVNEITDKKTVESNILNIGYDSTSKHIQNVDMQEALTHQGGINLKGFFQKQQLYYNHRDKLKEIFKLDDNTNVDPQDLVVHIRLGDYVVLNQHLHPVVYFEIIKRIEYKNCIIITDQVDHPFIHSITQSIPNCTARQNSMMEDFKILLSAKKLLISQSSFSWWASFLGEQDKVYVPLYSSNSGYPWKLSPDTDDIDLIPNNSKYVKIAI